MRLLLFNPSNPIPEWPAAAAPAAAAARPAQLRAARPSHTNPPAPTRAAHLADVHEQRAADHDCVQQQGGVPLKQAVQALQARGGKGAGTPSELPSGGSAAAQPESWAAALPAVQLVDRTINPTARTPIQAPR